MNICFFSGDITRSGGTERVSSIVANRLSKEKNIDICFLSLWEEKKETFFPLEKSIIRHQLFDKKISGTFHIFTYIRKIHSFVKKNKIDILVDIDGILDMYSIPALYFTKTKLVSWEQFNYYQNPYVNYRKYTRRWAARKADAIVVLTDEDKEYYRTNLKIRNILQRIYNPMIVEQKKNFYNEESRNILSAGRLTEQKGFDILIDVAKNVFERHPDWQWKIAGEGEDRVALEEKIKQYNLEKHVILCGNVDNIEDYYQNSAMFVLTSRYEGFGLVLTEAKSMGLPCVSFKCPAGPAEIIEHNVNGYLIDCFDVEEMSDRICDLICNKEKRIEFANNAMCNTKKFKIDHIVGQWGKLFNRLMEEKEYKHGEKRGC